MKNLHAAQIFAEDNNSENVSVLYGIETDITLVNDVAEEIFELVDDNQTQKAREQYNFELQNEIHGIDTWLSSNVDAQETQFLIAINDSKSHAKEATASFIIISLISIIITILLWYAITRDHKPL